MGQNVKHPHIEKHSSKPENRMPTVAPKIVVAGHICLDIIPTFASDTSASNEGGQIEPGRLYLMGPAVCATGGAVSNTGLALHQLGVPTKLIGKVGNDLFGGEVLNILRRYGPTLADGMVVAEGESTSYSVVISPPDVDRSFLHSPGANDTFRAEDVEATALTGARLLHFGYPPIMQEFYTDGGEQMSQLFQRAKSQDVLTSLDMAMPDPNSAAGRTDWIAWLEKVLPSVDIFLPSIDEMLLMLRRDLDQPIDAALLHELADQLLAMGAGVVVLKLGDQGLYLKSGPTDRLPESWQNRELQTPCFQVDVVGTTGAGDCTIAGFLAALVEDASPEEALVDAAAVGACSVEVADATSGIRPMSEVRARIQAGWQRHASVIDSPSTV